MTIEQGHSAPDSSAPSSPSHGIGNSVMSARTRALQEKLSQEDFARVADARRVMWKGGLLGTVGGFAFGFMFATVFRMYPAARLLTTHPHRTCTWFTHISTRCFAGRVMKPKWFESKHTALSILASGAVGGYIGSSVRGSAVIPQLSDGMYAHDLHVQSIGGSSSSSSHYCSV